MQALRVSLVQYRTTLVWYDRRTTVQVVSNLLIRTSQRAAARKNCDIAIFRIRYDPVQLNVFSHSNHAARNGAILQSLASDMTAHDQANCCKFTRFNNDTRSVVILHPV